ncbi:MAG TPA: glycosyltransferase family 2 protein [Candidatus Aminicenantes bacterium]|nr:glycosyltransferase family 2 protein [Candidatus Aminicenantes bacterium]
MSLGDVIFRLIQWIILIYFFALNSSYLLFTFLSLLGLFRYRQLLSYIPYKEILHLRSLKPISIIVPAFNEEETIVESVHSLLALEYPNYEVIVVNDGSTDKTLEALISHFKLQKTSRVIRRIIKTAPIKGIYISQSYPKLVVVDKVNGQKADALNAGLNVAQYPLFCAIDSDSLLDKYALLKIVQPFLEEPFKMVAAGGIIRLSNGCQIEYGQVKKVGFPARLIAQLQTIEYLRAFLGGRTGLSMLRILLIISGAFGLFRKKEVMAIQGYRQETVGEDMDLVVRLQKYLREKRIPYLIRFIPDPICWTEAPEKLKSLTRQRNRWHRGLIESLFFNRQMLFNPKYGSLGLFGMPYYVIFEMFGPFIEFLGYLLFLFFLLIGEINSQFAIFFFILAIIYGIFISLFSILLEEYSAYHFPRYRHVLSLMKASFLENFVFRQYLTLVRVKAFFDFLQGKKEWGEIQRIGFKGRQGNDK